MNKHLIAVSILSALILAVPATAWSAEPEEATGASPDGTPPYQRTGAPPSPVEEAAGWSLDGSFAFTTDYVFRGVSQTDEEPAVQGSIDLSHSSGLYAGVWSSNVDFDTPGNGIDFEVDVYAGYVLGLPLGMELDVGALRFVYPHSNPGFGIDYNEYHVGLSFAEYFTATFAYSNNFVDSDENSYYYELAADYPIGATGLALKGVASYYDIEAATGDNYYAFQAGANYTWKSVNLDLSYYDTASYGDTLAANFGPRTWADARVVFTISTSF